MAKTKVSKVLYLLPILFAWLGGIIGYFVARKQGDQESANKIFLLGLGITGVALIIRFYQIGVFDFQSTISPLSLLT